ncbi:hypothetical protein KI387_038926, partial [Taxus chinensis]
VKYEDDMRRITVKYEDGRPDISLFELRSKICNLFQLNGDAHELKLRYRDEDGDVITMANEDDLVDAFKQELYPFRVEVSLTGKNMTEVKHSAIRITNLGPFGGGGGIDWDDGTFEDIQGITVTTDPTCLVAIQVHYVTGNGTIFPAARHGGSGSSVYTVFKYPNEKLQKISGYCGLVESTWTVIKGLSFETNRAKYGPFGVTDWAPFEFDLRSRDVVGFYGRACDRYLGSIGLHAHT